MATKTKSKKHNAAKDKKASKKQRRAEREAKRTARKGDGSFPDILVVRTSAEGDSVPFFGYSAEDLDGLNTTGETVAVYKLRKVSTIEVKRKIVR